MVKLTKKDIEMRKGFTLVELLIGLAISAVLLAGLCSAIHASVEAYRQSSAEGVNRLTSRLIVERLALLVRTGETFGPLPAIATDTEVLSDSLELTTNNGQEITITWDAATESIIMDVDGVVSTVLGGVLQEVDGIPITPFTLEYEFGTTLRRATINLAVTPDPDYQTAMDEGVELIRLTASVMPRAQLYE